MRGAPQVGFSAAMRKIRARTSLLNRLRPPTPLAREIQVQYNREPARCQPITVLGVTRMRGSFHPNHTFRNQFSLLANGLSLLHITVRDPYRVASALASTTADLRAASS